ncbi:MULTISPECIES: hypothetical protein [Sulfitobacter]|jgi:hypothetical protein|uniref:Uncharacterized protein n=1 Tax=Sulfitobacter dubius TaxID=218673 RepID=A0ABY3ZM93_9RHOB|nr:hypothetical protein [Sulfitobacter dubius]UOA14771.1 hypothetical protein DSM109990_01580 [Sulfitobacter dubius]WOI29777.1 hypothetical protein R1T39_03465 [Sulfitobacter dubius]
MLRHLPIVSLIFVLCSGLRVAASEVPWALNDYIDRDLLTWVNDARIVDAIAEQNLRHLQMNSLAVAAPVAARGAAMANSAQPSLTQVSIAKPVESFLEQQVASSAGQIAGVTVLNAYGLTVVSSGTASVYFKGGQPKISNQFSPPSGAFLVEQVAFDDSTKAHQSRVSMPITEPSNGAIIGVITVELEAAAFF